MNLIGSLKLGLFRGVCSLVPSDKPRSNANDAHMGIYRRDTAQKLREFGKKLGIHVVLYGRGPQRKSDHVGQEIKHHKGSANIYDRLLNYPSKVAPKNAVYVFDSGWNRAAGRLEPEQVFGD